MLTINLNVSRDLPPYRDFVAKMVITSVPTTLSPILSGIQGSVNYDWGDGTTESSDSLTPSHTYTSTGTYEVRIGGLYESLTFSHPMFTELVSWGGSEITNAIKLYTTHNVRSNNPIKVADDVPPTLTSTVNMFCHCEKLTEVPFFNTSSVTNMYSMFRGCFSLKSAPLYDTSNVTSMSQMFWLCRSITTIPHFDTSKVTIMSMMFSGCTNLRTVPKLDTSNVVSMRQMFHECVNLRSNLSTWCVSKVPTKPDYFDTNVPTNLGYRPPIWGTCPT